jgi:glucosylceramidase
MRARRVLLAASAAALLTGSLLTGSLLALPGTAQAAGETVNVWLTTTSDAGGRTVTRGLQQQSPVAFTAGTGGSGQQVTVDENTTYQQFEGAGASMTDTAAWLLNSSGALSATTRADVMRKIFDPASGIGLSFLRNPMGASDLARGNYTYDDGAADPQLTRFSIAHDLVDVLPLTKQARTLNPALKVMATPWSGPGWMKDNGSVVGGFYQSQYYGALAQYFVKYIQAYAAQGVPTDYISVQNEPTCCAGYPSANWNASGLVFFTKSSLFPALRAAGISSTKTLVLDWNWSNYAEFGAPQLADSGITGDPLFGGIAWHGYGGDVSMQTTVHNQFPNVKAYDTEHSGGTWIGDQQREDMLNIIDYTRNWGRSMVKWSLAVDQNMGPHNGGCGTCTGLVTVHNGDGRSGQVDYTVEYYDTGHLTKFVRSGATRIASTDNSAVRNVAWKNPDGSKALVAYNASGGAQTVRVNWGGQSFAYPLPARTSATFTWSGTQGGGGGGGHTGQVTGLGGKCLDVASGSSANGTAVQLWTCNGSTAQQWTVGADGTLRALGKCLDVPAASTADGAKLQLWDCNGTGAQAWRIEASRDVVNVNANKCLDATGNSSADGTRAQIWTCTGAANQKWTTP